MIITFITSNLSKVEEGRAVLREFGIEVEHMNMAYDEPMDMTCQEIAKTAAQHLAWRFKKPVIVEDTGIYFNAYNNFPGPFAKPVFIGIGLEGCLKLLEGKDRSAHFLSCIGFANPGEEGMVFEGKVEGKIDTKITGGSTSKMFYDSIFIPQGYDKPFCLIPDVKHKLSHRANAFRKLGEFLKNKK